MGNLILFIAIAILAIIFLFQAFACILTCKCIIDCFTSCLCTLLVFLTWFDYIINNLLVTLIAIFSYWILITILKVIFLKIINIKLSLNDTENLEDDSPIALIQLFFISPDYLITKYCKKILGDDKEKRKRLIITFNILNVLLSTFLVSVFTSFFAFFNSNKIILQLMLCFLCYRIVSRAIEIIVSFVKDIYSIHHKSTLTYIERIKLAFLSILEVVILAFGIGFCLNIECGMNITSAACNAFIILNSLPDSSCCFSIENIAKIYCGLSCFTLMGIVISSYLGKKENSLNNEIANASQLFVMKNNKIVNVLYFSKIEKECICEIEITKDSEYSFTINDGAQEISADYSKFENENEFILDGYCFRIEYNSLTKKIKIGLTKL